MAVPAWWAFMRPVLVVLSDGQTWRRKDLNRAAVEAAGLTPEDLAERIKSGESKAESRAHWAIEYLAQSGAIDRPRRGDMVITDLGRDLLSQHPEVIRESDLRGLPGYQDWVARSNQKAQAKRDAQPVVEVEVDDDESPKERLIEALEILNINTAQNLVERLREQPPVFLERAVLRLLLAMGYGGSEEDGQHLGQSHDGGIDGVIRQDALGIERVYLQAKRYGKDNPVGASAIREFVGALADVSASAGIFITTSRFTSEAQMYAGRVSPRVILIDGEKLGRLMVDYEVGVNVTQTLRVTEVDENFFDDE
jgi:restriction system protein